MKVGDLVIFKDDGIYAKWFRGKIGFVSSFTARGADGNAHCRVRWIHPVLYHDRHTTTSDFAAHNFEVLNKR